VIYRDPDTSNHQVLSDFKDLPPVVDFETLNLQTWQSKEETIKFQLIGINQRSVYWYIRMGWYLQNEFLMWNADKNGNHFLF